MDNEKEETYCKLAVFSKESYEAIESGEAGFNNGFRKKDGTFMPDQPEFVDLDDYVEDDNNEDVEDSVDDDDGDSIGTVVAATAVISAIATYAAVKTAPYIKEWFDNDLVPGIKSLWGKITGDEDTSSESEEEEENDNDSEVTEKLADFTHQIDTVLSEENYEKIISSEEAQESLIKILGAAAMIVSEINKLSNACIKDKSEFIDLKESVKKLTAQRVTDGINSMLESCSFVLDDKNSKIFADYFSGGYVEDGEYIPLENENVIKALEFQEEE